MHEQKPEKSAPWRVPVAVDEVAEGGQSFALSADAETRAAIAKLAGLRDLPRLQANFEVSPQGSGGLRVVGRVSATVGQNCVVTLEPLANTVEEEVDLVFMPRPAAREAADEGDEGDQGEGGRGLADAKWDEPEPLLGGIVDLGALATEFLILGLDPYPRKPGAVFEPPRELRPVAGPFAALAGWTKGRHGR